MKEEARGLGSGEKENEASVRLTCIIDIGGWRLTWPLYPVGLIRARIPEIRLPRFNRFSFMARQKWSPYPTKTNKEWPGCL